MRRTLSRDTSQMKSRDSTAVILNGLACGDFGCECQNSMSRGRGLTHCPLHDEAKGGKPDLNVSLGDDGQVLFFCHVCGKDAQDDVMAALREKGLWGRDPNKTGYGALALEVSRRQERGPATDFYDYQDVDSNVVATICRDANKNFWVKGGAWPEDKRVLFNLPAVIAAVASRQTVFATEGEKDAKALIALGAVATCNPFGAGKFLDRYAEWLVGANVVICQDRDDAGRAHVKDVAQKLSIAARSVKILEFPGSGKDAADWVDAGGTLLALEAMVSELPEWTSGERVLWTPRELAPEYRDIIVKRIAGDPEHVGWRTGFPSIDTNLRYRAGDVWMVVAATSVGKSAFMQTLQRRAAVPSVFFSLEMSRTQLVDRLIAAEANVDAWNLSVGNLTADEKRRVHEAIDRFETTDMQIVDNGGLTTSAIESVLRIARVRFGIRLVFVDYLGLVGDRDGESRYVQVSNVSHNLKRIAKSVGVCMLVGSQVNRQGNRKNGDPPFLEEIRDSGVVGEDADVILALGRSEETPKEAKLAVRKARNAVSGYLIDLAFDALHAQFMEPSEASLKKAEARYGTPRQGEEVPT